MVGGGDSRKEPRWVVAFLRALERTGQARSAAVDAGIDFSTAYARRRAHGEFAQGWAAALAAHRARVEAEEEAEIAGLRNMPSPGSPKANPTPPRDGRGDLVVSAGKVRRVGAGRWSTRKEALFFEELAATSNLRMAADRVGMSTNAILARRHKSRLFAAKFDAVVHNARALIDVYLAEEARKAFDPDEIDSGEVRPRVTIDQAIKISQLAARKREREQQAAPDPFEDEAEAMDDEGIEAVRESILGKLRRIREADRREQLALGWSLDESFDVMVPPGWVRGPDYQPKPPELPVDYYSNYRGGAGSSRC